MIQDELFFPILRRIGKKSFVLIYLPPKPRWRVPITYQRDTVRALTMVLQKS